MLLLRRSLDVGVRDCISNLGFRPDCERNEIRLFRVGHAVSLVGVERHTNRTEVRIAIRVTVKYGDSHSDVSANDPAVRLGGLNHQSLTTLEIIPPGRIPAVRFRVTHVGGKSERMDDCVHGNRDGIRQHCVVWLLVNSNGLDVPLQLPFCTVTEA